MLADRAWKLRHQELGDKNLDLIFSTLQKNDYPNHFIVHWMNVRINKE